MSAQIIAGTGSGGVGHVWNIVKIGDVYYNIDTTWDSQEEASRTHHKYFLKNEQDFINHYRADNYTTAEFYKKYPMAEDSWMDYSSIEAKSDYHISNVDIEILDTIEEGVTVTNQSEKGRAKLLFFGTVGCANTANTLASVVSADFSDIDIIFIETNRSSKENVASFKEKYGNNDDSIKYVYDEGYTANWLMWQYVDKFSASMTYFPVLVYIDEENNLCYIEMSQVFTATHIRGVINTYLSEGDIATLSKENIKLNIGNTYKLMANIYGTKHNPQFFTWTSSNKSVATVDSKGRLDTSYNGKAAYNGTIYNVVNGKVMK